MFIITNVHIYYSIVGPSSKGSTVQPTTRGQILTKLTSNYPSTSNEATSSGKYYPRLSRAHNKQASPPVQN